MFSEGKKAPHKPSVTLMKIFTKTVLKSTKRKMLMTNQISVTIRIAIKYYKNKEDSLVVHQSLYYVFTFSLSTTCSSEKSMPQIVFPQNVKLFVLNIIHKNTLLAQHSCLYPKNNLHLSYLA